MAFDTLRVIYQYDTFSIQQTSVEAIIGISLLLNCAVHV